MTAKNFAREFAVAFTFAVTETSGKRREWIAKKGRDSIFAMLQGIFPEASTSASKCFAVVVYFELQTKIKGAKPHHANNV